MKKYFKNYLFSLRISWITILFIFLIFSCKTVDQFDEPIIEFKKDIELNPVIKLKNHSELNFEKALELFENARLLYLDGRVNEAMKNYDKVIILNPNFTDAYALRGSVYAMNGQVDEAISDYNMALELKPDFSSLYVARGLVYQQKEYYEEAMSDYNMALELNPDFAYAYVSRGNVHSVNGQVDKAISDYSKAIELNPKNKKTYILRAANYVKNREYDKARKDISRIQRLGHKVPSWLLRELQFDPRRDD